MKFGRAKRKYTYEVYDMHTDKVLAGPFRVKSRALRAMKRCWREHPKAKEHICVFKMWKEWGTMFEEAIN